MHGLVVQGAILSALHNMSKNINGRMLRRKLHSIFQFCICINFVVCAEIINIRIIFGATSCHPVKGDWGSTHCF